MKYTATADTDIGISRGTNEDSVLLKHAICDGKEVLLAVVCDGMGGLSHGELASATVVRAFSRWFHDELLHEPEKADLDEVGIKWGLLLKDVNTKILEYSRRIGSPMGTTFTGMLFLDDQYVFVHIGDGRIYHIGTSVRQLTTDHTVAQMEVSRGTMTPEEAEHDQKRNKLTRCIGITAIVEPQITRGFSEKGTYVLCTDGFRHNLQQKEMAENLSFEHFRNKDAMHRSARAMIDLVIQRKERDNISVVLVKSNSEG